MALPQHQSASIRRASATSFVPHGCAGWNPTEDARQARVPGRDHAVSGPAIEQLPSALHVGLTKGKKPLSIPLHRSDTYSQGDFVPGTTTGSAGTSVRGFAKSSTLARFPISGEPSRAVSG